MASIFASTTDEEAAAYRPASQHGNDGLALLVAAEGREAKGEGETHDTQKACVHLRHQLKLCLLIALVASFVLSQTKSHHTWSQPKEIASSVVHAPALTQNSTGTPSQSTNATTMEEISATPLSTSNDIHSTTFDFPSQLDSPVFVEIMQESGLCSVLLHFFKTAIYLKDTEDRDMIALDYLYDRYDRGSQGLMKGWFDPKFPVIDSPKKLALIEPYTNNFEFWYSKPSHRLKHCKDWTDGKVRLSCHYDYGQEIKFHYNLRHDVVSFYQPMVDKMCPHMQFNNQAAQDMDIFRGAKGVPRFDESSGTTVTFHVRRTDKIRTGESVYHSGEEYVARLLEVAPNVHFDHCFVATDAAVAVTEISAALRKHEVNCQVHYFASENEVSKQETLQFFTEMSYMINATYFVGTFDSNVGGMVGVLRACKGDKPVETFANSFGVDSDKWNLR